jgi:hypothetical protein
MFAIVPSPSSSWTMSGQANHQISFPIIWYLRHYNLGWVHNELLNMHWSRDPSPLFPRLQEICWEEHLHPLSPLFLPTDVDISTVIKSLQIISSTSIFCSYPNFFGTSFRLRPKQQSSHSMATASVIYAYGRWWTGKF